MAWSEPIEFRMAREREAARGRRFDPVPWLIVAGLSAIMIFAMASRGTPGIADSWPISIGVALLLPAGMLLFVKFVSSRTMDRILVSAKGINRNGLRGSTWTIEFWSWDRIDHLVIATREVGGRPFRALVPFDAAGAPLEAFGIDRRTDPDALARRIEAEGKMVFVEE
jgi:hypothetical protein